MANMINSLKFDDNNICPFSLPYGVCSTAANTVAKTVTVDNFSLEEGATIIVKFTNTNSASNPTLNVNSTGAKPICRYGTAAVGTGQTSSGWRAGAVQVLTYDGTSWVRTFWENTTYSNASLGSGYGTCSTAAATAAKTASISSYALTTGGIVLIKFTNAVPANATLNITSKGAKNIFYRGAKITADVIKAGDIATFIYDGTQYQLIAIDRWQEDIDALKQDESTAFSSIQVNGTSIVADSTDSTLTLEAGTNVTLLPDVTNDTITIAAADTHYTTGLKVGASATATANAAATNGKVYLNLLDNTTIRDSHKITGSGATTVTSDANGVITIKSTDTTYSAATSSKLGLVKVNAINGISINDGVIMVERANANEIAAKTLDRNPITPKYLDTAVKVGVTTNTIALTDEEKSSACSWLGALCDIDTFVIDGGTAQDV